MLNVIKKLLKLGQVLRSKPFLSLQLEITSKCNLNCTHCYCSQKNAKDLSLNNWKNFLTDYKKTLKKLRALPSFSIAGGEPTISPYFFEICTYLCNEFNNPPIAILTNGYFIDDNLINFFKRFPNIEVQISIDGPDEATHEKIRGSKTFDKTLASISKLVSSNIPTHLQATLQKTNIHKINEFFELAKNLNVRSMNFTRYIPQKISDIQLITKKELQESYELIFKLSQFHSVLSSFDKPLYCLINNDIGSHGLWGFQGLTIDFEGNLKPSSRIDFKLGSLLNQSFFKLYWEHPIMINLRTGKIESCGQCQNYSRCGGDRNVAYALTKNILAKDPQCWLNNNEETL